MNDPEDLNLDNYHYAICRMNSHLKEYQTMIDLPEELRDQSRCVFLRDTTKVWADIVSVYGEVLDRQDRLNARIQEIRETEKGR